MFEEGNHLYIEVDLPGVNVDDIDIRLREDRLILDTKKPISEQEKNADYYLNERHYGNFHRKLYLPYRVDAPNATVDKFFCDLD
jgi:HSP20 family protein